MRKMLAVVFFVLAVGCYDSEPSPCTADECASWCLDTGYESGACVSAPPDGPVECACIRRYS